MSMKFIEQYEKHLAAVLGRRERTIRNYVPEVTDFLRFVQCREATISAVAEQLRLVDQQTLLAFLTRPTLSRTSNKISGVTWNMRLAAIRSVFAFLCSIDALPINSAMKIERQRTFDRQTNPLTLQELISLVESVRDNSTPLYAARNVAIVQVLVHTALRVNEVVSLNVDQVDLEHYLLLDVRRKGGKALASAINDVVASALSDALAARKQFNPSETQAALFLSGRGTRLSVRTVQELVKLHGKLAGIRQPVTPHLLRHSSATQFAAMGTPLRVVQEICGHASISTTQRYVHPGAEDRQRAVEAMAVAWKKQSLRQGAEGSETTRLI